MELNIKDMDIGALLGAIETIKECLEDTGFEGISMDFYVTDATNDQMTELATKFMSGDRFTNIMVSSDNKVYIQHPLDNYSVNSLR